MKMVQLCRVVYSVLVLLALSSLVGCGGGGDGVSEGGGIPKAPSNIQARLVTADSTRLTWIDNSSNEVGFQVGTCSGEDAIDAGGTYCASDWVLVGQTTADYYNLVSLESNTSYSYYVGAFNSIGASNAYRVDFTTSRLGEFSADRDNTVRSAQPNTVFSGDQQLGVGCDWQNFSSASCTASLIFFDLSSLAGVDIESATLFLTVAYLGINPNDPVFVLGQPHDWQMTPVADTGWNSNVTWNIAINGDLRYRDESEIRPPPLIASQVYNVDVTAFVKNWTDGIWANNGMILELTNYFSPSTVPSDDAWGFFSSETADVQEPKLEVVYR